MRQLLNTLFVTSEDVYLSLEGENVLANKAQQVVIWIIIPESLKVAPHTGSVD